MTQLPLQSLYQGRMLNLGHRGARQRAPENTIKSFQLAFELGADGVELDVWLSSDNIPVVIHDEDISHRTNGMGRVTDLPLATLQSFDAGEGEHIPTLEEVFHALSAPAIINVEIKDYRPDCGVEKLVLALIDKYQAKQRVMISSFDADVLRRVRDLDKDIGLGYLTVGEMPRSIDLNYQAQHPHFSQVTPEYIVWARAHNRRVNVWTINDVPLMQSMRELGVDALMSDVPDVVYKMMHP